MKKAYLIFTVVAVVSACIAWLYMLIDFKETKQDYAQNHMYDEEYLIYPSDSTDKWDILFANGNEYVNLKPEQIALFLKSGEIPEDTTWVIYPQCEYQLTMEDKEIVIEDFGRPVLRLPYEQTGKLGELLIKHNE
jgi:hypothetical protein